MLPYSPDQALVQSLQLRSRESSLWPLTMSVLTYSKGKDPRSNPCTSINVVVSSAHTERDLEICLLITFQLACWSSWKCSLPKNWIRHFSTIVCQPETCTFLKTLGKLQTVIVRVARVSYQSLTMTESAIREDISLEQQLYFSPSNQDNGDWHCCIFRWNWLSFALVNLWRQRLMQHHIRTSPHVSQSGEHLLTAHQSLSLQRKGSFILKMHTLKAERED